MTAHSNWKYLLLAGSVALLAVPWAVVRGAGDDEPQAEASDPGVVHAECLYLGPQRDRYVRGGQQAAVLEAAAFSELTTEVARALPPPARSRTQGLLDNGPPLAPIDQILFAAMKASGVTPADRTTDAEFLRRVTLDLTGRIPKPEDLTAFLADTSPNKRIAVVNRLVASPEWVDKWTMFFGDLFKNSTRSTQVVRFAEGRDAFYNYLKASLTQNKPYDQMARELIAAAGANSYQQGELNFAVGGFTTGGPVQDTYDRQAADTAEMFLGLANMDCLLCHDGRGHLDFLNLWGSKVTRYQAWGLSAFFGKTQLARVPIASGSAQYYWSVQTSVRPTDYTLNTTTGNRPERQPRPGQARTVLPVYPFSGKSPASGEDYRTALGREVTSDFQFARATVNYIWKKFFGLAIVEPANQFDLARLDASNPPPSPWTLQPSNAQLLQQLAQDFVNSRYDLKSLMREIANSQVYQLSTRYSGNYNTSWDKLYARKLVRRLDAEEVHDALVQASGIPASYQIPDLGTVQWAMQFPETVRMPGNAAVSNFLDGFLRGDRDQQPRNNASSLPQALSLMNDNFVLSRTRPTPATGLLGRSLSLPDDQLVQTLFLNVLSRYPTDTEREQALAQLKSGNRSQNAQNLLWTLYNKVDFVFNY